MGARFGARTKITFENLSKYWSNSVTAKRSLGIEKLVRISNTIENMLKIITVPVISFRKVR
jgi:hypothetical protein